MNAHTGYIDMHFILSQNDFTLCGLYPSIEAAFNKSAYISIRFVIVNPQTSLICLHKLRSTSVTNSPSRVLESPGVLLASGAATYVDP
jgi:hypothetical protein